MSTIKSTILSFRALRTLSGKPGYPSALTVKESKSSRYQQMAWLPAQGLENLQQGERRKKGKGGRSREEKNRGGRLSNTGVDKGFLWYLRYAIERRKHRITPAFTSSRGARLCHRRPLRGTGAEIIIILGGMMGYERTPQTLAIEDMESIKANLAALDTTISKYAINLKLDEKQTTYKLGAKALPFVELALKYATEYPQYCPNYFNLERFRKNFDFYSQVKGTVENIVLVVEKLTDSYTAVGGDVFGDGRAFYDSVRAAAKANKPGADAIVAELRKVFYKKITPRQKKTEEAKKEASTSTK